MADDQSPAPNDLVEMAHPDLPTAEPVQVTRRRLDLVWAARGWHPAGESTDTPQTPDAVPAPDAPAARRKPIPAAEAAAVKES